MPSGCAIPRFLLMAKIAFGYKGDIYVVNAKVALQFLLPFMKDMT
jgi:hypothetical protein